MPERAAFHQSVAGDRKYTADRWADIFAAIQTTGYIPTFGSELAVQETSPPTMGVRIMTGAGFVRGRYYEVYTTPVTVAIAAAHATLNRKDLVVIRDDLSAGVRNTFVAVKQGANAATMGAAVLPSLQQDATIWEVGVAQVNVAAADTAIQNADITDMRATLWGRASLPDLNVHKTAAVLDHPNLSVTTAKIALLAITNALIANGTIAGDSKMVPSSITGNGGGSAIGVDSIHINRLVASLTPAEFLRLTGGAAIVAVQSMLAAGVINNSHIQDGVINAVAKLAPGSITGDRIATDTILATNIGAQQVGTSELVDFCVTAIKIGVGQVQSSHIANANVLQQHMAVDSVAAIHIVNGSVGSAEIANGAVDGNKIAALAIGTSHIGAGQVTYDKQGPTPSAYSEVAPFTITTSNIAGASLTIPVAGLYDIAATFEIGTTSTSINDANAVFVATLFKSSGAFGPNMSKYFPTNAIQPGGTADGQKFMMHVTFQAQMNTNEPIVMYISKNAGTGGTTCSKSIVSAKRISA